MKDRLSRTEIDFLATLTESEAVEVINDRGTVCWRGTVEISAPTLGLVWIRTEAGERKLLDIQKDVLRPIPPANSIIVSPNPELPQRSHRA